MPMSVNALKAAKKIVNLNINSAEDNDCTDLVKNISIVKQLVQQQCHDIWLAGCHCPS